MNQLIRCRKCDEVFMRTPFDQYPLYLNDQDHSLDKFQSIEKDDFKDFLSLHQGHPLEPLEIIEDSFVSEKAYFEPVKTSFFKATNGKEKFVIKKFRERIDEPLKYQLILGDYSLRCTTLEIQSEEIIKHLKREISPPLSPTQIDAFLKLYQHIIKEIDTKKLERVKEESSHPMEVYYKLDDLHLMYLLRNCRNIFKGSDYSSIEEFIYRHRDDGVLLLKATFKIQITERVKVEEKVLSPASDLKEEKAAIKK